MDKIITLNTIHDYNELMGLETLHPLVSVINLTQCPPIPSRRINYGLYAIFLKDGLCGKLLYGRQNYDYQEGTIVCVAPGQLLGVEDDGQLHQPLGIGLVFHPDLIRGTSLGQTIGNYHFFSYESNEALHLSQREREVIIDCIRKIEIELHHDIDTHSNKLIARNIELLLDYCDRFYDRQFITRSTVNHDVIVRFESILNDYFNTTAKQEDGIPSVASCAGHLNLSPNYFGDLVKKETGVSAQEYIQKCVISKAKERLLDRHQSIGEVAYSLGFKYPQHFTRLFKQRVGCTPNEYRTTK